MNTPLRLPHLGLLRFAGADAATFLQGQVSNDTRPLANGTPVLAAYSTPQGRVAAVLHLIPHSSGILAILPRELVLPTGERLRKYVLRAKVKIDDVTETFAVIGLRQGQASRYADLPLPDPSHRYRERDGIGVAQVGNDPERMWAVGEARALAAHGLLDSPDTAAEGEQNWRLADIRSGLPQVYAATQEQFVAQMLNLDLIDGISFTKGCYTGQEIIARTQHLGRIKRRLFRLRLPNTGGWTIGQTLQLSDGRSGRLTEVARTDSGFEALAVLNLEAGGAADPDSRDPAAGDPAAGDPGAGTPGAGGPSGSATGFAATRVTATELPLPYPLK